MMKENLETQCCIAGGGPAGIMLGYLLARSGIDVVILEKWPDFFRDFRGDTIHPSTMNILDELGLLEDFLALPHQESKQLGARIGGEEYVIADFARTRLKTPFIAFMPQWDFLNFIAERGRAFSNFHLLMQTEAAALIEENGRVVGVRATGHDRELTIRADLVVGADGRHSTLREQAGFTATEFGAPMDVLWFRVSRQATDPKQTFGSVNGGHFMILIERGEYWQCGFVIPKGGFRTLQAAGLPAFRAEVRALAPFLGERVDAIRTWDEIKFLAVTVDRLESWARDGLLCIGDAAHAMSPVGGVGINLAIQDAVAAANILAPAFVHGAPPLSVLRRVERRRLRPVRVIQFLQLVLQKQVIGKVLTHRGRLRAPLLLRLLARLPLLTAIPAYLIGMGVRSEHVATAGRG